MKKFLGLLCLFSLLLTVSIYAQPDTVKDSTNITQVVANQDGVVGLKIGNLQDSFLTFTGFVLLIPFLIQGIRKIFPWLNTHYLITQVFTWVIGIGAAFIGWYLQLGIFVGLQWWLVLIYGVAASLCANGVFDTGLINTILSIFKRKSTQATK